MDFLEKQTLVDLEWWIEQAALLDKFYIPTHSRNGLPDLTPGQVYTRTDAQRGLEAARALITACREWVERNE